MWGNPDMLRALLPVVVVVAAAAGCARPAPVAHDAGDAPEAFVTQQRLRTVFTLEDGHWVSPLLEAPAGAARVAAWLSTSSLDDADAPVALAARGVRFDGSTTRWFPLVVRWTEAPQRVLRAELPESVAGVQVRVADADADRIARLVYSAVSVDPDRTAVVDVDPAPPLRATGAAVLRQAITLDGVTPRAAWDARDASGCDENLTKTRITVHHAVSALQEDASSSTHAAAVRGIQSYHMDGRGYCDIAYHFAVTADGTVWEGREAHLLGAHTGGHNTDNAGMVFVGCFHPSSDCDGLGATTPPQAMVDAGGAAIGRIAAHYAFPVDATTVIGHRDNPEQTTACPGDHLHALLPELRALGGAVEEPSQVPTTGIVMGVVWDLSITSDASEAAERGALLPGAVVSVAGGPSTTARDDDAIWSFELSGGAATLTAQLEGFAPASRTVQVDVGIGQWASIGLLPLDPVDPPDEPDEEEDVEEDEIERVTLLPRQGGCGCAGTDPDETGPLVWLAFAVALVVVGRGQRVVTATRGRSSNG